MARRRPAAIQSTGGGTHLADVGYPIAELHPDGATFITKPSGTGGAVNRRTVVEQLVYEIGDPAHYLTPDVDVDFTTVEVAELAEDRVAIRGATGRPAPPDYKVSLTYADGFTASGQLLVWGPDCTVKARVAAETVFQRLHATGFDLDETHVELLGAGDGVPGLHPLAGRLARSGAATHGPRPAVRSGRPVRPRTAPLVTSGPAGLAGYAQGRPTVRPVFAYWPTLVPKSLVQPHIEVRTASEWSTKPS